MAKYRKKPIVIEAFQMTLERRWDNSEWPNWLNEAWQREPGENAIWIDPDAPISRGRKSADQLVCGTLEGVHRITFGDWIIKGVEGEIYLCKPAIFEQTYEAVQEEGLESMARFYDVELVAIRVIRVRVDDEMLFGAPSQYEDEHQEIAERIASEAFWSEESHEGVELQSELLDCESVSRVS